MTTDEGELVPNAFCSLREPMLKMLEERFWRSFSCPSPLHTLLSSVAALSSDRNLASEKSPWERWPMLMLRTTRDFLEGLCRTCFSTTVFSPRLGAATTSLSAGWLRVKEHLLSSTGKSVVMTPFVWQLRGRGFGLLESWWF